MPAISRESGGRCYDCLSECPRNRGRPRRVLNENGSDTTLYFDHGGAGPVEQVLNLAPIPPGTTTYTIAEQALANQNGVFLATQNDGSGESGYNEGVNLPKVYVEFIQCISCGDDDDDGIPPPDPTYYLFSDSYHHRDHLGNLRIVTNSVGALAHAHDYYPFGTEVTGGLPASGASRIRYTGHERDEATSMDYMFARYYSPSVGRFLSRDPASSSKLGRPQSWNRYTYVVDNPIRYVDPDGENPVEVIVDFTDGAIRGAAASASMGTMPGSAPKRSDSTASLFGQLAGSATVTIVGALTAIGGGAEAVVTSPVAVTGVGAVVPGAGLVVATIGTTAAAGGVLNMSKISDIAGSGSDLPPERDGSQDKRLSPGETKALEARGYKIHDLKGGKRTSHLDLFKDQQGNIYVKPKTGEGPGEPTGLNINDFSIK